MVVAGTVGEDLFLAGAALGFRTVHVTSWLKKNRAAFDLTEAEWQRVFPGSGRRRRREHPQHGPAGMGVKLRRLD